MLLLIIHYYKFDSDSMKRKIYILILLSIFFISTTGLPLTVNICSMKNLQSPKQCKMHMDNMQGKCHTDKSAGAVNMTKGMPVCCQIKIVDNTITDNFISLVNDTATKAPVKIILISGIINCTSEIYLLNNINTSGSPPLLSDNHIYLTNSILLI